MVIAGEQHLLPRVVAKQFRGKKGILVGGVRPVFELNRFTRNAGMRPQNRAWERRGCAR